MQCRFCKTSLENIFIDLGNSPPSNSYLSREQLDEPEFFYPLKVYTCHNCFLVQIDEYKKSEAIFNDQYAYFSSYSTSWLDHARRYTEMTTDRFNLGPSSSVVEIASNDGYLLQYFREKNIPVLGIEPTANTAAVAIEKGIETVIDFFGTTLAQSLIKSGRKKADLLLGNNVLAHVPDIVDFVGGLKIFLANQGVVTMEFPHLMELVDNNQFDTIYHEHFSYLSFHTVKRIFESQGLNIFDVERLSTHGGSLRIFAAHAADHGKEVSQRVNELQTIEIERGLTGLKYYSQFQERALAIKLDFTGFLIEQRRKGKLVAAYGAAAKGNTLLNYCGVKGDMIEFVADANPHKQNKWLPGSHIPVVPEGHLKKSKPDYVIILPWNLQEEIKKQLSYVGDWGGKFVIPIPSLQIV